MTYNGKTYFKRRFYHNPAPHFSNLFKRSITYCKILVAIANVCLCRRAAFLFLKLHNKFVFQLKYVLLYLVSIDWCFNFIFQRVPFRRGHVKYITCLLSLFLLYIVSWSRQTCSKPQSYCLQFKISLCMIYLVFLYHI